VVGEDGMVVVSVQPPALTVPAILVQPPLPVCQDVHQILGEKKTLGAGSNDTEKSTSDVDELPGWADSESGKSSESGE